MNDLLQSVLASPNDDLPRLVYADWLEENEEPERAEFIRKQIAKGLQCDNCMGDCAVGQLCPYDNDSLLCPYCDDLQEETGIPASFFGEGKVIYRRGFPDEIRCTMAQWVGATCSKCNGDGFRRREDQHNRRDCQSCNGTGRTPGIAKQVCEAWPVTKVVLVGVRVAFGGHSEEYFGPYFETDDSFPWCVDRCIFDLLDGFCRTETRGMKSPFTQKFFLSETEALAALSHAAVNYGRRLAGLPELKQG